MVANILEDNLRELRPGYLELTKSIEELRKEILLSHKVQSLSEEVTSAIEGYIAKYWDIIINAKVDTNMKGIMDDMLIDIKSLLSGFDFVNSYDGYQVIADIWKDSLTEDIELIGQSDFYTVARTRIPKMVTKGTGSNKREEQEGWISSLIPSELIIEQLFSDQASKIDRLKQSLSDTELELDELVEAAKVEDSEEYDVLFECITKNKEGEAGNSFTAKAIKDELKKYKKDTEEYNLLKKAERFMEDKSKYSKDIRKGKELKKKWKTDTNINRKRNRLPSYEKWFDT